MATTAVRGVELAYDVAGLGLPTMIWGHGLTSSRAAEDERPLLDFAELRRHHRLVRYDARGHGGSGPSSDPAASSWAALALDQLDLADQLGIDRYVAGGASMGCGTALHAAVAAPGRVLGLVLVIPPTAWETRRERADIWAQAADVVADKGVEPFIAASAAMPQPNPHAGHPEWRDAMDRNLRATSAARLSAVLRGAATADLPPRDAIATITVPCTVLAWSGDPAHPVSTAEQLVDLLPRAELSVADTWDELQTWTSQVAAFLGGLRTASSA